LEDFLSSKLKQFSKIMKTGMYCLLLNCKYLFIEAMLIFATDSFNHMA